jgi:para-nitrobenzyl esterase
MVFDFSIALLGAGEKDLAQLFVAYWTNFAANGDPHVPGLPDWPAFGAAGNIAQIDTNAAGPNVTVIQNLHTPQCSFWGNLTIPPSAVFG